MPNTKADLARLESNATAGDANDLYDVYLELLAIVERLLGERGEAVRIGGRNWEVAREHDHRSRNLRAELIERCETMERMASGGPCWLVVFLEGPGRGPEVAPAIHFSTDEAAIWGTDPEGSNADA